MKIITRCLWLLVPALLLFGLAAPASASGHGPDRRCSRSITGSDHFTTWHVLCSGTGCFPSIKTARLTAV